MKTTVGITVILIIGVLVFKAHQSVVSYNSNYRIAKQAYLNVKSKVTTALSSTTEKFDKQLQSKINNITTFTLFDYFEKNGSAVANLHGNDSTAWVWRKLPNAEKPVGFGFLRKNNEWFIDTVGNLDILVLKIEHVK